MRTRTLIAITLLLLLLAGCDSSSGNGFAACDGGRCEASCFEPPCDGELTGGTGSPAGAGGAGGFAGAAGLGGAGGSAGMLESGGAGGMLGETGGSGGSNGNEPPSGAQAGAYFSDIETVIVGGVVSEEPLPAVTEDIDAPIIESVAVLNVDDDEAALEITVDSAFLPTAVHLDVGGTHVKIDILPPITDYEHGNTSDLPGYSFEMCRDSRESCYDPCHAACAPYAACEDISEWSCLVFCSAAANEYYRCPRDVPDDECPPVAFLRNLPDTLEELAATYVTNHRFLCSEPHAVNFCAPPIGVVPTLPASEAGDDQCQFDVRASLATSESTAPPRKRRTVRVPLQVFNFPSFAQASIGVMMTSKPIDNRPPLVSEGFAPGELDLSPACPSHLDCL